MLRSAVTILWLFVGTQALPAPANSTFRSLEEESVPANWQTDNASDLTLTAERYKSGRQCLRWSWRQRDGFLVYRNAEAFAGLKAPAGKKPGSAFGVWLYNEQPAETQMRVEVLHGDDVVARCWFWMDFDGWRPVGAVYGDIGWKPGARVDGVRFRAPDGVESGRLYLDYVSFDLALSIPRSYQMPWVGIQGGLDHPDEVILSDRDLSRNRPWLPARKPNDRIAQQEREDMAKLVDRFLPKLKRAPKGLKPEALEVLRKRMAEWRIKRQHGIISGDPIDHSSFLKPPAAIGVGDYMKLCGDVKNALYQAKDATQAAELRQMFVDLAEHFVDQGWGYGSGLRGVGSGYTYRYWPPIFYAMRDVLAEAGLLREVALTLAYQMAGSEGAFAEKPVASMDTLHLANQALIPCTLMLPDETERLQWLRAIQRYYSLVLVNPKTLGPDGCAYHHWMHHYAYASYSMPFPIRAASKVVDTVFRIDAAAHERLKRYVFAMAFASCKYSMPANMNGRAGTPMKCNMAGLARILAEMGTPDGKQSLDPEMAGLYLSLTDKPNEEPAKTWREQGIDPLPLTGHWTMNGTAAALHRRDHWLLAIVGMVKFYRGLEIYGWLQSNNYARYARNGSIMIHDDGDPVTAEASGYAYEGWNWCHWPGATSLLRPSHEIFNGYAMYGNPTPLAGGTHLGDDGIWGMDFQGAEVHFRKSAFCFDNRITVITTDIRSDKDRPAVTTLFQNRLDSTNEALWIDGESVTGFPMHKELDPDKPHWLVDNKDRGYYGVH